MALASYWRSQRGPSGSGSGFTLIELMIVVVLVAVLATVATIAYTKHVKKGRVVDGSAFIVTIQARQESYYMANGVYGSGGAPCPSTLPAGGAAVAWPVATSPCAAGWTALNAAPDGNVAYFQYTVTASTRASNHDATTESPQIAIGLGITNAPVGTTSTTPRPWRAWYYVIGAADLDSSGGACGAAPGFSGCTVLSATSQNTQIITRNEGQ
jgi:prepilin-type N-terminal cleavage/methylation domain-containing protein